MVEQIERVSLVTGGKEGGIGFATAELLGQEGPVYLTAHFLEDAIAAARALEGKGLTIEPFGLDVTNQKQIDMVTDKAADLYGPINTLVTSHAVFRAEEDRDVVISRVSLEEVKRTLAVITIGTLGVIQAVLPAMEDGGKGDIGVFFGSWGSATRAREQLGGRGGAYGIAKAGETYVVKAVAADLDARGHSVVRIFGVDPGKVKTNMNPNGIRPPEDAAQDMVDALVLPVGLYPSGTIFRDGLPVAPDSYEGQAAVLLR